MAVRVSRKEFLMGVGTLLLGGCGTDEGTASGPLAAGTGGQSALPPNAGQGAPAGGMGTPTAGAPMQSSGGTGGAAGVAAPPADAGAGTTGGTTGGTGGVMAPVDSGTAMAAQDAGVDAGSDSGAGNDMTMCMADVTATSSGQSHTHDVTIPGADIMAGGTRRYESNGSHTHWIELVDADFAMLRSGGTVRKTTCSGGDHIFELRCGEHVRASELPQGCGQSNCGGSENDICPG